MMQNGTSNTSIGTSFGILHSSDNFNSDQLRMINLGMFYKLGNAIVPYVGYAFNNFQFGLSYDVNVSPSKSGSISSRSFEISFMYRVFDSNNTIRRGRYYSPF